jgi:PEGA domain
MRNPTLSLGLSLLLLLSPAQASLSVVQSQDAGKQQSAPTTPAPTVPAANSTDTAKTLLPGQFILQDGTPVRLRLSRNVSSADAHTGDSVDFEVLEDVAVNGILVIPKGSVAIGSVTEAQPKRRMGRAGKLEIVLDYVRLGDSEKAAVRAVKDAKGGSHTAGMTAGIVATGLLFFPAAPFFLFMHGKDITVPKGAEITAYVNGDVRLESKKFGSKTDAPIAASAQATPTQADPPSSVASPTATLFTGSVELHSTPDGAEVYVDGAFVGNAPATLKLAPGQHTIKLNQAGYKEWSRDITVQAGSEAHLTAALEKP